MMKPNDWDKVQAYGQYTELPADGYICKILKVEETTTRNGKPMIKVAIDIDDGDYRGFFTDLYKQKKKENLDAKYPFGGMCYINCQDASGNTSRQFKTFCESVEESGGTIEWGDTFASSLTNNQIGVIFRREQSEYNGKTYWNTRPFTFTTTKNIAEGQYSIPAEKPLAIQPTEEVFGDSGFTAVEEDIPF